ncbi:MAG: alpha/beta hydrolase [Saccharospirillaceae bacterium]|nr:alpha/beta hydrolase [Colwellia sp.]NRB77264.1 alpha/beta hydrolase [Saccharospirillaceae bacterium]
MELKHKHVLINDVNIHYVAARPSPNITTEGPTIIFLHGFPEYWQTWQNQLSCFSKNHHVIAPDLPGYNLSDKPQEVSFYQISNLIEFMAKFIKTVSPTEKVHLVAHDWGGAIAWPLAAFHPQLIEKLIIINAAHPSTFTREMITNPEQRDKSAYIHDLISDDAETLLSAKNYQYLSEKMMVSADQHVFTKNVKEKYRQVWQRPGAINGMLQYYRAMPQLAAVTAKIEQKNVDSTGPVKSTSKMKIPNIRINVPTLILWGEQDQAFVKENLNGVEHYIPDCTIKRFANASHWLMHEKPIEINNAISQFIDAAPG